MSVVTLRDNGFEISMIPMIENLEFDINPWFIIVRNEE